MANMNNNYNIPVEKLQFANVGDKIHDQKFEDKPIGYFKDAWIRFRKNKASIVAMGIILAIVLFAIFAPIFNTNYDKTFIDPYYAKKAPRNVWLADNIGIMEGNTSRVATERGLIWLISTGIGAEHTEENLASGKKVTVADGMNSYYTPVDSYDFYEVGVDFKNRYKTDVNEYFEVGFVYMDITQEELNSILAWQAVDGNPQVLYPLIANNDYTYKPVKENNANYWYKSNAKGDPIKVSYDASGDPVTKVIDFSDSAVLEDNYMTDSEGNYVYYVASGGGTIGYVESENGKYMYDAESGKYVLADESYTGTRYDQADSSQRRVRVLYYNYYQYKNGFAPNYIFGTDSQGYDLALRMADGIRLSLIISVFVCAVNFTIGAIWGAIAGYYGGIVDLTMERITDILSGIPSTVVMTLFQIHLAQKVGVIPSLLFAFVLTGWIGMASQVRTQFYRFKNQEYVMAARTLGARDWRIIWKHIFPNTLGTIITGSVLAIPGVIFTESMLSFLGIVNLGGQNTTSLGTLLSDASGVWTNYPHLMLFPAIIISLLMICFNLFGNGLRDAFNPSLRGAED